MIFSKQDLQYKYSWITIPNDDPRKTGPLDSTLLSRKEGYEVLYFINAFAQQHNLKQKSSGKKIEKMLMHHVPGNIRKQDDVREWIVTNWKTV